MPLAPRVIRSASGEQGDVTSGDGIDLGTASEIDLGDVGMIITPNHLVCQKDQDYCNETIG